MSRQTCVLVLALCLATALICPESSWLQGTPTPVLKPSRILGLKTEATFFENLSENLEVWVFEDAGEATKILRRYHQSRARYRHFLDQALRGGDRERQLDTLTLIGLLRLQGYVEASLALAGQNPADYILQEGVAFYLHRIGREPAKNLERMLASLPRLLGRPSDDWVIFWMGFVDTPEPARDFLSRIRGKADGAVGELVSIAQAWLTLRCPGKLTPSSTCKKDPWF